MEVPVKLSSGFCKEVCIYIYFVFSLVKYWLQIAPISDRHTEKKFII